MTDSELADLVRFKSERSADAAFWQVVEARLRELATGTPIDASDDLRLVSRIAVGLALMRVQDAPVFDDGCVDDLKAKGVERLADAYRAGRRDAIFEALQELDLKGREPQSETAALEAENACVRASESALAAENRGLRLILSNTVAALGNGGFAVPECSPEFLRGIPAEVNKVVARLQKERR